MNTYIMRSFIIYMVIGVLPVCLQAQINSIDYFYNKYKGEQGFTTLNFSGNLLQKMLNGDASDAGKDQINDIMSLTIISTESDKNTIDQQDIERIKSDINQLDFEELLVIYDHPTVVKIVAKEVKGVIREIVMIADQPDEFTLISFKGKIQADKMGEAGGNIQVNGKNYWNALANK